MAACTEFTCSHCAFKVEAWDDGNRYLTDSEGKRHFFYHPGYITGNSKSRPQEPQGLKEDAPPIHYGQSYEDSGL